MSALSSEEGRAAVGRRIQQARRELGLTQAELAATIGVSLGVLDRYETGRANPSDRLDRIAEATDRPVSWFTSSAKDEPVRSEKPDRATDVGVRIAQSRRLRSTTRRELADAGGVSPDRIERYESGTENPSDLVERIDVALAEPGSSLPAGGPPDRASDEQELARRTKGQYAGEGGVMDDSKPAEPEAVSTQSAQSALPAPPLVIKHADLPRKTLGYSPKATADLFDQVADAYRRLWEDRTRLKRGLDKLQVELAEEREKHGDASEDAGLTEEKLKRADVNQRQLALQLEQVASALAASRAQESQLSKRVSELETELQLAEEREKHGDASEDVRLTEEELKRAHANQRVLAAQLEQATSALAGSRVQEGQLSQRVSDLETELQLAEERAVEATDRLTQSEAELARFREQERSLAEALVWARHTASEWSEKAEQEAARIVQDAERRAAELLSEGEREVERLTSERHRLQTLASEVQEDLSVFLLGTLERLKERVESRTEPGDSVPDATGVGEGQRTGKVRKS
jgi:transcriptional regulator with XRE-family HTH domain/cell division septum initiation protein DivIVA